MRRQVDTWGRAGTLFRTAGFLYASVFLLRAESVTIGVVGDYGVANIGPAQTEVELAAATKSGGNHVVVMTGAFGSVASAAATLTVNPLQAPLFMPAGGLVRSPALVVVTNPNPSGGIFYTLDGSDPRDHFGNVVTNARSYSDPLSVSRSMIIRARVKSGTNWSELVAAPFTTDQDFSKLLFTELMYHPSGHLTETDRPEAFVELKNVGGEPLDLSGLEFAAFRSATATASFWFPNGTLLGPGDFLVLVRDSNAFRSIYPLARIDGQFLGGFDLDKERLAVRSATGGLATTMFYYTHAPWPAVPDNHHYFTNNGVGFSLVRANLDPAADPEDSRSWRASAHRFGSPGEDDPEPTVPPIYVNELLTRSSSGLLDSVELFNPNPTNVHVGGWWLSDERNFPFRYQIPPGTVVPAFGFLVLDERQFNSGTNGFAFSAQGDRCYLFSADTNGILTGYSHGLEFEGSDRDVTFGRHLASDGIEAFPAQLTRTLGTTNSGPRPSPVVISEVMYHPDGTNGEYVELRNTTSAPLQLWDPQLPTATWAIRVGYDWQPVTIALVPTNTTIPANDHLLFVQDDPDAFRARHNVPTNVPVVRLLFPLGNGGEEIRLYRPSGAILVEVDKVSYDDRFPWPAGADGGGYSLERIDLIGYGNDPANWRVCPAISSPGRPNSTNLPPLVWAGGDQTRFINRAPVLNGAVSDDRWPGTALTTSWSQVSGPASAIFTSHGPASAAVTFPEAGRYVVELTATDGVFTNSDQATIDVVERPFDAWGRLNFTPAELADATISGAAADPDNDGSSNLDEYFFNTPPKTADPRPRTRAEIVGGRLQIAWTQVSGAIDLTVTLERADELQGPWFNGSGLFQQTQTTRPDGILTDVLVRELVPLANSPRRFTRIRVALAE